MVRDEVTITDNACDAPALPDGAHSCIILMPTGAVENRPHDGRRPPWLADPEAVVAPSCPLETDLPIDFERQTDWAWHNGCPAPAAGFFMAGSGIRITTNADPRAVHARRPVAPRAIHVIIAADASPSADSLQVGIDCDPVCDPRPKGRPSETN